MEDLVILLDNNQINKLKYFPPKKMKVGSVYEVEGYWTSKAGQLIPVHKLNNKGHKIRTSTENKKDKFIEEKWVGYCKASQKTIPLTLEFVHANFTPAFLD